MKLRIFNWEILTQSVKEFPISEIELISLYTKIFNEQKDSDVNLIFTSEEEIKGLNTEFRNKKDVTDVLSFNLDSEDILGEIYICPKHVGKQYSDMEFNEEILRLIIHGTLHLLGYDHKEKFKEENFQEEMFVKQEEILENILKVIK